MCACSIYRESWITLAYLSIPWYFIWRSSIISCLSQKDWFRATFFLLEIYLRLSFVTSSDVLASLILIYYFLYLLNVASCRFSSCEANVVFKYLFSNIYNVSIICRIFHYFQCLPDMILLWWNLSLHEKRNVEYFQDITIIKFSNTYLLLLSIFISIF